MTAGKRQGRGRITSLELADALLELGDPLLHRLDPPLTRRPVVTAGAEEQRQRGSSSVVRPGDDVL